jgi:hypothetical protein
MTRGVVVSSTATAHWAWVGLRLLPAPTLAESRAYPDVEEPRLRAETSAADRAWLSGLWTTEHGARWEVRYTNHAQDRPVSCVLLGRVHGRDLAAVTAAAVSLRDRLAVTPGHVRAEPILDADEVRAGLAPLEPAFELRKRLDWTWSGRRDSGRRVCFALAPLVAGHPSWEAVWHALARLPSPTTVGVCLAPYQPSAAFADRLRRLAVEYTGLAGSGRSSPMWKVESPPDPFAVTAAPGYVDAFRRYAGRCYRVRISVAAAGPVDPGFVALLGATTGTVACRVAPGEADGARRTLATMDREWFDETYRQGSPPGELDDAERILCDLVDEAEANAAFRLPYELPDHVPPFTASPTTGHRATAGGLLEAIGAPKHKRVFVSYVGEDLDLVERLVLDLRQAGYDVWMDRSRLLPGQRWRQQIKRAIATADFFIACFSPRYWKDQTFMNEELIVAIERFRLMPRDRPWFIPAMLAECELPDHAFGPNETLAGDMQYADFGTDWHAALRRVLAVLDSR